LTEAKQPKSNGSANGADAAEVLTPELVVRKYASAVLGVCLANTKNLHDGEDIMQDVFLKAVEEFGTLRDHSRARPWLLQIARRMCVDYHRGRRRSRHAPELYSIMDDVPAPSHSRHGYVARLHEALSKLPEHYRETLSLYYLDGRKCASVAENLGISEVAVRRRLVRGRLMLHDLFVEDKS
jgi:RNA polymerase sigma-70 factor (ECF subfamily)